MLKQILSAIIYVLIFMVVFNVIEFLYYALFSQAAFPCTAGSCIVKPAVMGLVMFFVFRRYKRP